MNLNGSEGGDSGLFGRLDGKTWAAVLAVFALFTAVSWNRVAPSFWSADNGVKWWQAETIAEKGIADALVDYPLADLDPEGKFQPLGWKFGRLEGDRIRFTYPPFYPYLLSLINEGGGFRASILFTGLIAALLIPLLVHLGKVFDLRHPQFFSLFLVVATPLLVYSIETNEHLLGLALGLSGWLLLYGGKGLPSYRILLLAGGLLGLAGWVREEYWIWGAACCLPLLFHRDWKRLFTWVIVLAGMLASNWMIQAAVSPETQVLRGVHIHQDIPQTSFGLYYFRYRWALLNHWLFSWGHYDEVSELSLVNPWPIGLMALICLGVFWRSSTALQFDRNPLLSMILVFFIGVLSLVHQIRICLIGIPHISGLFFAMPLLTLLPLIPFSRCSLTKEKVIRTVLPLIAFGVILWMLAGSSRGGRQWGPRYFMIAWPFLLVGVWRWIEIISIQKRWIGILSVLPILSSQILTSGYSFITVRDQQSSLPISTLSEIHGANPDRVFVTDQEYLPAAAVGVGHSHWAVLKDLMESEEGYIFLKRVLDRDGDFLWCGREDLATMFPSQMDLKSSEISSGLFVQLVKIE